MWIWDRIGTRVSVHVRTDGSKGIVVCGHTINCGWFDLDRPQVIDIYPHLFLEFGQTKKQGNSNNLIPIILILSATGTRPSRINTSRYIQQGHETNGGCNANANTPIQSGDIC